MESRRKAGNASACPPHPSRRAVFVGGVAAPLAVGTAAAGPAPAPAIAVCERWLAVDAERRRLQTAWGKHESWLIRERGWFRLTASEQAAVPEGARLAQIDARLDVLEAESHALLKALPHGPAASVSTVIANLSVAAGLLFEEDHPEAYGLVVRAARDLRRLGERS